MTKSLCDKPSEILFKMIGEQAQYVLTKSLHSSQRIVERHKKNRSITFVMKVVINYELERLLLGYGENIQVQQPLSLAKRLREIHRQAADLYGDTLWGNVAPQHFRRVYIGNRGSEAAAVTARSAAIPRESSILSSST